MSVFSDYTEIKDAYEKGKVDIYYEHNGIKYQVRHLGSTFYCHNLEHNMGMGAIQNFPIERFYSVDKPVVVEPEPQTEDTTIDTSVGTTVDTSVNN